ncbi:MAG TPA: tetratricopeptide repeat protein [Pirellulales bacterium]|nr:tetratricopeptide repeat protein [Pirellulales bacterium]
MRRSVVFRLLWLMLLAASASRAYGEDHQHWVGRAVMPRSARCRPRVGGRVAPTSIVCVRTVERVKGDWLSVGDGWLRYNEVVPVEEAVAWFTAQLEQRPSAFGYLSRGAARCAQGDYDGAGTDCAAALRINPRLYTAYYHRAAARAEQGRFKEAIGDYDAALRLNPRLVGAYLDRGRARLKLGDYPGSLADVNHALRLSPREPDAHYVRGVTRFHLHQYRGALADLNYALRAKPGRAAAYDVRGACQVELGQLDDALHDFDKAIELDPSNVSVYSHRDRLRMARATTNYTSRGRE